MMMMAAEAVLGLNIWGPGPSLFLSSHSPHFLPRLLFTFPPLPFPSLFSALPLEVHPL